MASKPASIISGDTLTSSVGALVAPRMFESGGGIMPSGIRVCHVRIRPTCSSNLSEGDTLLGGKKMSRTTVEAAHGSRECSPEVARRGRAVDPPLVHISGQQHRTIESARHRVSSTIEMWGPLWG